MLRFQVLQSQSRPFSTSARLCRARNYADVFRNIKNMFVKVSDLEKRPSDKEILAKNLPLNTPTLLHRIKRDEVHKFHVSDRHGGYHLGPTGTMRDYIDPNTTLGEVMKEGYDYMKTNTKMAKDELMSYLKLQHQDQYHPSAGEVLYMWNFADDKTDDSTLNKDFIVSSDSTWGEGYSWGSIEVSPGLNSMLFFGDLNTTTPQDGRTARSGYVSVKSVMKRAAFNRKNFLPFEHYDALRLKIRGDGRTYFMNIHLDNYIDMHWFDLHQYPIYTRGGPYWQDVIIPFSKFYLLNKGAIQDAQGRFAQHEVTNISFTLCDRINGPFRLELAQIGVEKLRGPVIALEQFAYESYRTPHKLYLGSS